MSANASPSIAGSSPLGQRVDYRNSYAPELLFPIERAPKRAEIGIERAAPFWGEDLWNAYELSWLNTRGKPVAAIGSFRVPASSPRLIESKSLKLYLNSLNATRFESLETLRRTIADDLSAAAGARVGVTIECLGDLRSRELHPVKGILLDTIDIEIDRYTLAPESLRVLDQRGEISETLVSHLLKSNCPVTGQPDWGTLVVRYRGSPIDHEGLLRYLVSFREHDEFHEQCVERIFMALRERCAPQRLAVWARYTRRGGLDINPFRADVEDASPPPNDGDIRQ